MNFLVQSGDDEVHWLLAGHSGFYTYDFTQKNPKVSLLPLYTARNESLFCHPPKSPYNFNHTPDSLVKPKITLNRSVDSEILPSIIAKVVVKFDLKASSRGLGVAAVGEPVGLEARPCIIHPRAVACQLQSWELVDEPLQAQFPSLGGRDENPSNNLYSLMQMMACIIS